MAKRSGKRPVSRDAIEAFIRDNPDRANKRDIARAFGLKGDDRIALKHVLAELEEAGVVEKRGKRLALPGALPPVAVLEITGRDGDGALIARPVSGSDGDGDHRVTISVPRKASAKIVIPGVGDRVLTRISRDEDGYRGRVIKRLEKPKVATLGVVRKLKSGQWRVLPVERRDDELDIKAEALNGAEDSDLVEIDVTKSGRYGLAQAKVISVIGALHSEKAVSAIALHAHGIPHIFPDAVIAEAEAATPPRLKNPREDWRELPLITIDPADAKDHDDAVHAAPDDDPANAGGHVLTVAIADVAHFVKPGSALDREAVKRGNSVYFPDRVVPMLPERISNDLCSLKEGEDRPAMAVRIIFDASGRKKAHTFHRIMMRSAAKLSYDEAQAAFDGKPGAGAAALQETVLKPLWAAYKTIARGREKRQPLELDLPERKIILKPDGTVGKVIVPPRLDAHKLIEECMIQANVAAAETLEGKQRPLVFRVHDSPSLAKQEALREFLKTLDIGLARGAQLRPSALNQILSRVEGTDNAALVNSVVLRAQAQAEYSPDNYGHFGLNLQRYAHFTSPIRRYADLIVHRALISALGLEGDGDGMVETDITELRETAALISKAERRATQAERDTIDRLIADHLDNRTGETFDGTISGVSKAGLFVTLPQFGADGFIPVASLGEEYFLFDEARHAMIGERSAKGFQLGDPVEIRIEEVQPLTGSMRFSMVSDARSLGFSTRSRHKTRSGKRKVRTSRSGRPTTRRGGRSRR